MKQRIENIKKINEITAFSFANFNKIKEKKPVTRLHKKNTEKTQITDVYKRQ